MKKPVGLRQLVCVEKYRLSCETKSKTMAPPKSLVSGRLVVGPAQQSHVLPLSQWV